MFRYRSNPSRSARAGPRPDGGRDDRGHCDGRPDRRRRQCVVPAARGPERHRRNGGGRRDRHGPAVCRRDDSCPGLGRDCSISHQYRQRRQRGHDQRRLLHRHLRDPASSRRLGRPQRRWQCEPGGRGPGRLARAARNGQHHPDCPSHVVGPAAGVMVLGQKVIQTFLAGAVGLNAITVSKQSTAAAGYLQESCTADAGDAVPCCR